MPFFSIIIPTLNSSCTLERCLSSLRNQNFTDFEVLILDGGSIDGTSDIVKISQESGFEHLIFYENKDKGVYDAMNKGLKLTLGQWVYFLGSDDWFYHNEVLQFVYLSLEKTVHHVAYGDVLIHGNSEWANDQEIYAGKFNSNRLTKKNICHQSIFYRTQFLKSNNLDFDLSYPINSDWDLNLKCIQKTDFQYLDLIIANFSSGGLSSNSQIQDNFFEEMPRKYPRLFPSKFRVLGSRIKKMLFK